MTDAKSSYTQFRRYLRFIDDPHNIESGNDAGVLGGLSLGIIEVGWHRHDSMGDRVTKVGLCRFLGERKSGECNRRFGVRCKKRL